MSKYFLVKVSPIGKREEISSSFESESLIASGEQLKKKNPDMLFAVTDEFGFYIWPEDMIKTY